MRNTSKGPLHHVRAMKAQISLHICTVWSGHFLPAFRINAYCRIYQRTEMTLIRLCTHVIRLMCGCAGWSWPSLFVCDIRVNFPRYIRCIFRYVINLHLSHGEIQQTTNWYFSRENRIGHFMQNCFQGIKFPILILEKISKIFQFVVCWKFY